MWTIEFNTSQFKSDMTRLANFCDAQCFAPAADVLLAEIQRLTAAGLDADEIQFHPYSRDYAKWRKAHNLPTSKKDLFVSGRTMGGLRYAKDQKAVVPASGTEKIVQGQMSHPNWPYHHNFFAAGAQVFPKIESRVAQEIKTLQ